MFQFGKLAANVLNSIDAAAAETLIRDEEDPHGKLTPTDRPNTTLDVYSPPKQQQTQQDRDNSVLLEQYEEQITALKKALRHQQMVAIFHLIISHTLS